MINEKSDTDPERDLFGVPVGQLRERWGRPSFAKSDENQRTVMTLRGAGWSQKRIARYMGCDEKTLRKHFSRQLQAGADFLEGQALEVLVSKMRGGSIAAAGRVRDIVKEGRAAPPPAPDPEAEAPEEKLGKKEQLARAAQTPSGGWGGLLQ